MIPFLKLFNMKYILFTGHRKSGTSMFIKLFDGSPYVNNIPIDLSLLYAYFPILKNETSIEKHLERIKIVLEKSFSKVHGLLLPYAGKKFSYPEFEKYFLDSLEFKKNNRSNIIKNICHSWIKVNSLDPSKPILFKETSQSIFCDEFFDEFQDLKVIHLVRDPRDNWAAIKAGFEKYYKQLGESEISSLLSHINRVQVDLRSAIELKKDYRNNFEIVRFEDLVINTLKTVKEIEDYINIPHDPIHIIPTEIGRNCYGNSHDGKKFEGVSSENVDAWRSRINEVDAMTIEWHLKDLMKYFGYKTCFSSISQRKAYSNFYDEYNTAFFFHDSFS